MPVQLGRRSPVRATPPVFRRQRVPVVRPGAGRAAVASWTVDVIVAGDGCSRERHKVRARQS